MKNHARQCDDVCHKHYDNPHYEGEKEFQDDLKRFKIYQKTSFRKYYENDILKERLLINHIIVLSNVFGIPSLCNTSGFLKYKKNTGLHSTFCIPKYEEDELPEITLDKKVMKVLKEL